MKVCHDARDMDFIIGALFDAVETGFATDFQGLLDTARGLPNARYHLEKERRKGLTLVEIAELQGRGLMAMMIREAIGSL